MSVVRWLVAAAVFLALLFVSLDNADPVTIRLFRVATWQAPLVFVVFAAFVIGVALGLLAGIVRTARLKRELGRLRREHRSASNTPDASRGTLPPPDAV